MPIPVNKLSTFIVAISSSAFVTGLIAGIVSYVNRSSRIETFIPGSNAIPAHIVVVLVAIVLIILVAWRHSRMPKGSLVLLAPFSRTAFERFQGTLLVKSGFSFGKIIRAVLCVFLGLFLLFSFWRAGLQVIGGLDPNFVINAWGGPSYIGASLIHWLDGTLMFYGAVALLNFVTLQKHQ